MRFHRLDLLRYGHFSGDSLHFPHAERDFHIIYGPNEAGKSTALAAIEDLLFGIETRTRYGFLHAYADMRIGACLEDGDTPLEILRRKGTKNTLLDAQGNASGGAELELTRLLGGADRSFHERMFGLDHERLRTGGQDILTSDSEVGELLFAAGSGIVGLRQHLHDLSHDADNLWTARRSRTRAFYIAEDKFTDADRTLRDLTLNTRKWQKLKQDHEESDSELKRIEEAARKVSIEQRRLNRIGRVFRVMNRLQDITATLDGMQSICILPTGAAESLSKAERLEDQCTARLKTYQEQRDAAFQQRAELDFDERIVDRSRELRELCDRRIQVASMKDDLPRRQAEHAAAIEKLRNSASELEWDESEPERLIERIPSGLKVSKVRSLLARRGEIFATAENLERNCVDAEQEIGDLQDEFNEIGEPFDVSKLAIVLHRLRRQGDLDGGVRELAKRLNSAKDKVERRIARLNPSIRNANDLMEKRAPAASAVREFRDKMQDIVRQINEKSRELTLLERDRHRLSSEKDRIAREAQLVTESDLLEEREKRDNLWKSVKNWCVTGRTSTKTDHLLTDFETASDLADALADRRFEEAEAASRILAIERELTEIENRTEGMKAEKADAISSRVALNAEWTRAWAEMPFDPLEPEVMLEWLDKCEQALEAIEERDGTGKQLSELRIELEKAQISLAQALRGVGIDPEPEDCNDLVALVAQAEQVLARQEAKADKQKTLKQSLKNARRAKALKSRDRDQAVKSRESWTEAWYEALCELGLSRETGIEETENRIAIIDDMRTSSEHIRRLKHERIKKMELEIETFAQAVSEMASNLAPDLASREAEETVLELERRHDAALKTKAIRDRKDTEIEELEQKIALAEKEKGKVELEISGLMKDARVSSREELPLAVERSDQKRALQDECEEIERKLKTDGDGKTVEELAEECSGADIDDIATRETKLEADMNLLRQQQGEASARFAQARDAFEKAGGDDAAARCAADRQQAAAEIQDVAARYIRFRTSALLLRRAIERFRQEKQGPLLFRAGDLFCRLTSGSFTKLQVVYDDKDKPGLAGQRDDGREVPVSGLSTGSADQLFLALRIAAVENHLERAPALPFVADDLFINFDDERAAIGLQLLEGLSRQTQVLFFTHHRHIVEIARKTLGSAVHTAELVAR